MVFMNCQFAVSSTLDDRPTIYYFKSLGFKADFVDLKQKRMDSSGRR